MAENGTAQGGELRRCSDFFVTYYWTLPAIGFHFYANIVLITISVSSAFLGSFVNILVVLSYFKSSSLRTLSNIPLLSLALSDLLVTAVVLPLHTVRLVKETYGTRNCILWTFLRLTSYFSGGISLLTVTLISVERYITLAYPYHYQAILTRTRMKRVVAYIWFFCFVLVMSHLGLIPYKAILAIGAAIVLTCIVTMLSIWAWVYKLLREHKRKISIHHMPSFSPKLETNGTRKQTYKNTWTSGAIVLGLILCYLPLVVMLAFYWTEPTSFVGIYLVTPWGEIVFYVHSLFNPFYVFYRKSEFRQTAKVLICR